MQLLDYLPNKIPVFSPGDRLLDCLQDIVNNLQIKPNFCISHPNYKPLELPAEMADRFLQVPLDLQNKYLSLQLRSFIYGIYYNGSLQATLAPDADAVDVAVYQNLANNTVLGVDQEFYDLLHENNKGEGYFDPGWCVIKQESDGSFAVSKGGLILHVDRDSLRDSYSPSGHGYEENASRHLESSDRSITLGDLVAIRMPRNLVQNGFYVAVSNMGVNTQIQGDSHSKTVRLYFNLTPEGAVTVMESLTRQLNEIKIPFTFKVLYNPSEYKRYDSGVLYFNSSQYESVRKVIQTVYAENQSYFQAEVPLFAKLLAPGLGLAEEPDLKFVSQESFGMNRCQIVANGLLEAQKKGDESPENRMTSIFQQFSLLGIDWQQPYLNANSEDIYTLLELC